MTREEWLGKMVARLRPEFEKKGATVPKKVRASCGFPSKSALANKARRLGEAWSDKNSEDQSWEVFISPLLKDSIEVAGILVHELVHTAVGIECGHRGPFKRVAVAMGLEGKMTATTAGEQLKSLLTAITDKSGPYPHARLVASNRPKTQTTRMHLVKCPQCGYQVRTTRKWLEVGVPTCPCGSEMVAEESDED